MEFWLPRGGWNTEVRPLALTITGRLRYARSLISCFLLVHHAVLRLARRYRAASDKKVAAYESSESDGTRVKVEWSARPRGKSTSSIVSVGVRLRRYKSR